MNVTFYTFSKRRNSTKRPAGGTSYTCVLKEGTSTSRPAIMIKWQGSGAPSAYNYAYIAAFGRYYWVNSWEYDDRCWTAYCSVDVLATYKTQIGSSTKYVLRAASTYDPEIIDTLYSPKAKPAYGSAQPPVTGFQWADDLDGGMIIVGIIGMRDTVAYSAGGVSYYACTPANYIKLLSQLFTESLDNVDNENYGSSFGEGFKAFSRNLLKSITNPTQYIKSVTWFPFSFTTTGAAINPIIAGVITNAELYPLADPIKRETVDFSVSFSINSSTDYWKNIPPFVRTTAYLPPYGTFDIDRRKFLPGINSIRCFITTDAVSGLSHLLISSATTGQTNNPTFGETICQVGVPLDFTGVKTGNVSLSAAANTAASVLGGNMLGAAAGVSDLAASAVPTTESRSSYGGISGDIAPKYIETVWYEPQDEDNDEKGRPLCQNVVINTLSGYILCADGEVDCPATQDEHGQLEAFLTGGFFYE